MKKETDIRDELWELYNKAKRTGQLSLAIEILDRLYAYKKHKKKKK